MVKATFINHYEKSPVPKMSQKSYRKVRDDSGREPKIGGNVCELAMALTCHNCKKLGHKMKDCKQLMEKSDKSSNVENSKKKWCSYHHTNGSFICSSQSQKISIIIKYFALITRAKAIRTTSAIYAIYKKRSSAADSNNGEKDETFVADSTTTVTGCDNYRCKSKVKNKYTEIDDEPDTPPVIGSSFAMCHPPLS